MLRGRYKPVETPDRQRWVILDRAMDGYCTLPDAHDPTTLLPLEWRTRQAAEAWLQRCYRAWQHGTVPAPAGWRPHPPEPLVR
ncbi:hypothetical protein [Streptomyces albus]|uniref:hypothetical protein n=1 Tax=Streptomyces albus TaxID=1888 RepID=UPI003F196811